MPTWFLWQIAPMHQREPELQRFISSLNDALLAKLTPESPAYEVTGKIMSALQTVASSTVAQAHSFSVCNLLGAVVDELAPGAPRDIDSSPRDNISAARGTSARTAPASATSSVVAHAQSLLALTNRIAWWQRPDAVKVGEPFMNGHANATIIGPGGLEERHDVWVGVSLLAPGIDYPVHHHPPEEVYLVLSEGHWNQDNGPWHQPGIGGVVHNPPHILHAMRSGEKPLLATWCLWIG